MKNKSYKTKNSKTSHRNPTHQGASRTPRSSNPTSKKGTRWTVGLHSVKEALKVRSEDVLRICLRTQWESSHELQEIAVEARRRQIPIEALGNDKLERISGHSQGVVAEMKDFQPVNIEDLGHHEHSIILFLDGVEDPHNLGAILRSAWLLGIEAIILPLDRAVGLTPAVHKVSCGGVEHVPVLRVPNFTHAMNYLKEKGFWIYGLSAQGKGTISKLKLGEKVAWVLGAEDKGLRSTTEKMCDELVSIPQMDNAASYNVSVAAGITMYESRRQQGWEKL